MFIDIDNEKLKVAADVINAEYFLNPTDNNEYLENNGFEKEGQLRKELTGIYVVAICDNTNKIDYMACDFIENKDGVYKIKTYKDGKFLNFYLKDDFWIKPFF